MNSNKNRISLGTVQFGLDYGISNKSGQLTLNEIKLVLKIAEENKVDTLDTAIAYGSSESCLGELGVEKFKVITKLPELPDGLDNINDWVETQVHSSMVRLGVKSLYGLLLHKPQQLLGAEGRELYRSILNIKDKQEIEKIGVSIYSPSELNSILKKFKFDLVQAPFNMVDQRIHLSGWLYRLKDRGIEVHARSVFLQGLLMIRRQYIPIKFTNWDYLWSKWEQWLVDHNESPLTACLSLPLSYAEIDKVVVGVDSAVQLSEIMDASICLKKLEFPDIRCNDERLINPSRWGEL